MFQARSCRPDKMTGNRARARVRVRVRFLGLGFLGFVAWFVAGLPQQRLISFYVEHTRQIVASHRHTIRHTPGRAEQLELRPEHQIAPGRRPGCRRRLRQCIPWSCCGRLLSPAARSGATRFTWRMRCVPASRRAARMAARPFPSPYAPLRRRIPVDAPGRPRPHLRSG